MKVEKKYSQAYSDLKDAVTNFKLVIGKLFHLEKTVSWMKKKL